MNKDRIKTAELQISKTNLRDSADDIEKILKDLKGVEEVELKVDNKKVKLRLDSKKIKLNKIEKTLRKAGYEIDNKKVILTIAAMNCMGCTGVIENSLKLLDGVTDVRLNFRDKKAEVTYNPSLTSLEDINNAVTNVAHQYITCIEGDDITTEEAEEIIQDK
ncbi:MAG: heavy-metal-associated domain-containing protein [Spirochaetota bacterium]